MIIVFDLETTCWENNVGHYREIIEIGAVKLDDRLNEIDRFDRFVRPEWNPILSDFCAQLTTIT